jgi:outer membrane protein assembly factor BamB
MRRVALLLLILASCKKSREDTCDQLAKMGTAFANELGKRVGGEADLGESGEIKTKMAELKAECMKWPNEVFDCMHDNDETSPKCKEAMQHVTGVVATDIAKAPAGPRVVATAELGAIAWDGMPLSLAADGTVIAMIEEGIVSYAATGKPKWRVVMSHDRWMLVEGDYVFAGDHSKHEIVALDVETGDVKWRVAIPQIDEYSNATTEGGVRIGGAAYVPLEDGRVLRVDPAACAKPEQAGCLELAFRFSDEEFDNPTLFALGNDIVFGETTAIRRISTSGEVLGHIHVRDDFGGATPAGEQKVAAIIDDELVLIDFASCTGETPYALRRKQGRMYIRGEGDCEGCRAAPEGCVVRTGFEDVDSIAPAVMRDGSLVASNWDGPLRASSTGKKQWVSDVDSVGPLREVGDAIAFLTRSREEDTEAMRIGALDSATGKAKWSTPIAGWRSKDLTTSTEATLEVNESWIVVGVKGRVAWLKR